MYRRIFALILAFAMVFSLLPGTAMATDGAPETEPAATEAQETEPKETEPKETEPKETEPKETEPKETEPKETEAKETEPKETEPKETEPQETEPQETEPVVTEPVVTEPEETEPQATQPVETQPAPDQKVKFTNPGKRDVEEQPVFTAKFTFEFPVGGGLSTDVFEEITVHLVTDDGVAEKIINEENDWTATFDLSAGGDFYVYLEDADLDGYTYDISGNTQFYLDSAESISEEYIVRYDYYQEDPGEEWYVNELTVSLIFAEDSDLKDADVGDIIVYMENEEESDSAVLSNANGRTAELQYEFGGYYRISFNGLEQDGYTYSLEGDKEFYSYDNVEEITFTIKYTEGNPQFTVSLDFAEDSALQDADIGDIIARIYGEGNKLAGKFALTQENGRTASIALEPGLYEVRFGGAEREGYNCSLPNSLQFYIDSGEGVTRSCTLRYLKDEATLTVSLGFAEDSAFQDADFGDISAIARNWNTGETYSAKLTSANGRTAELTVPSGEYSIFFEGHEKDGYACDIDVDGDPDIDLYPGNAEARHYTLRYAKDEAKLTVSLGFAEDSPFQDADFGDITVYAYNYDVEKKYTAVLTSTNDRTAELKLPSGSYEVGFSGHEKDGYFFKIEEIYDAILWIDLAPGADITEVCTANYTKDEARITISLDLDGESDFDDADIGKIIAEIYPSDGWGNIAGTLAGSIDLTKENGRTGMITLPSGDYYIVFSGYEKEGYVCSLEDADFEVSLWRGEEADETYTLNYTKDEAKLVIGLSFSEISAFKDADIGAITAKIYDGYPEDDGELVKTVSLTQENTRTAEMFLPSGSYYVCFEDYEKADHYCTLEGNQYLNLEAGGENWLVREVVYVRNEAKLLVSLDFAEDSALDTDDLGDITAQIYRTRWEGWGDEPAELVGSVALPKENGRKGELTIKLDGYFCADPDEMDYGYWVSEYAYELQFAGMEQDGYRYVLAYDGEDRIGLQPGEEDGWNVTAKYAQAEHNVTVNVRLSEDSDVSPAELKGDIDLSLEEMTDAMVSESASHPGSKVFTYTFADLPASDSYRLNLSTRFGESLPKDITVQSITCTEGGLDVDLEKGQVDFALDGDREINIVLRAKQVDDKATVIVRFTEDSLLQAEDFPDGIRLMTSQYILGGAHNRTDGKEYLFTPEDDWTRSIHVLGETTFLEIVKNPDGFVGTVELSARTGYLDPWDCPTTVYADICFVEEKPYYLDVDITFDDQSALKGADIGSIFMNINDSGIPGSYEFKEGSWHQTIEFQGDINGHNVVNNFTTALNGLARDGYSHTVYQLIDGERELYTGGIIDPESYMWQRGQTWNLELEICYTAQPGKLVVDIVSGPYGWISDTTITVKDASGNVVAQTPCGWENDYRCIIELPEAGTYTISQTVNQDTAYVKFYADGDKTIEFDPDKGAAVTLLNEERYVANVAISKVFEDDSELGPEDFPNGVTVTLAETTGIFNQSYVLSDANGWSVSVGAPEGCYTVTETGADKDGYVRTTRFVFSQVTESHDHGGLSLRGQERRDSRENAGTSTTYDTVGGPYGIHSYFVESSRITVYNTYKSTGEDPTGSITITAGDGFYDFDSNEKLDETPDTGNEVDEYTYIVDIDGEVQEITLKPGEEITIDGVAEGAVYTVTPVLPDGYPWNASAEPITGTIGGETDSDEGWNVEVSFENDYYYTHEEGVLTIVKTDALTGEKLKGAQFGLYSDKDCTKQVAKATTGKDGICSFDLTEEGTFYIKELKAPEDYYVKSEEVKTVTVKTEWVLETREGTKVLVQKLTASVADLAQKDGGYIWENERKTTDISVTKKFAYDEDLERPESVTIVLYQDGEAYETVKLSAANNWKYVWKDMPLGFEYTVDELNVAKGYYKQIRCSGYDFTVTNSGSILPQTGDMTNIALWGVLALASIAALTVLIYKRKKKA